MKPRWVRIARGRKLHLVVSEANGRLTLACGRFEGVYDVRDPKLPPAAEGRCSLCERRK